MSSSADIAAGDAFVRLTLEDKKYLKGLRHAQQKLLAFGRGVEAWGRTMLKVGATVIGVLGAAVAHFVRTGDAIGDIAERTGIAAGKMAEFAYAAEKSESSAEALETALKKMAVQIQALRDGGDAATQMFRQLGLGVNDFLGLKPDEQFELIASRLNQVADATTRSALATKIFGRAGTELLPMMRNLNRLRVQARREGLLPSEEAIRDAGAIDDAMKRVRATISATTVTIGHAFSPAVLEGLETVRRIAKNTKEWIEQNLGLVRSVGRIGVGLLIVGGGAFALGKAFQFAGGALNGVEKSYSAVKRVAGVPLRAARSLVGGFGLADRASRSLRASLRGVESAATRAFTAARKAAMAVAATAGRAGGHAGRAGLGVARVGLGLAQMGDSLAGSLVRTAARDGLRVGRLFAQGIGAGLRVTRTFFGAAFDAAAPYAQRAMGHVSRIINREAARWSMLLRPMFAHVPRAARVAFLHAALFVAPLVQKVSAAWQRIQPHATRAARAAVAAWRVASVQIARGLVVAATGAFNRIRAMGVATTRAVGAGIGNIGRGIGGAISGIAGVASMLGAGAGGAFGQIAGLLPSVLLLIPAVGALINPFTILAAAIAGAVYLWTQFSDEGQAALASVMNFLQPFIDTFKKTWQGISDSIAAGDLMGAANIALAGLKVAFLQGISALSSAVGGVWGDFIGQLGSQIAGGDFAGAWDTIVAGMYAAWDRFVAFIVKAFTDAAKSVVDVWGNAVSSIANKLLAMSAQGGLMGSIVSQVLGVDMSEEQARAEMNKIEGIEAKKKLLAQQQGDLAAANANGGVLPDTEITSAMIQKQIDDLTAQLARDGSAPVDVLGDAQADVTKDVGGQVNAAQSFLDGLAADREAQAQKSEAELGASGAVAGGQGKGNKALTDAQAELDRLTADAARKRAEADAAANEDAADYDDAVGGVPDSSTMKKEVVGSFTAAAFAAQGQGGGSAQERIAKGVDELVKETKESRKDSQRFLRAMEAGGGFY